jgi:DNA-binding NtrC family response regulator
MAYNILVVEDTPDWRKKLVGYLIGAGEEEFNIYEADNYESASQLLKKQPLDVVVMDIRLVDWDEKNEQGMQLLRELDEVASLNGTQSIVITGYGTKERMREAFRDHQVVDFIEKQRFDPEEFKAMVLKAAENAFQKRGEILDNKYYM